MLPVGTNADELQQTERQEGVAPKQYTTLGEVEAKGHMLCKSSFCCDIISSAPLTMFVCLLLPVGTNADELQQSEEEGVAPKQFTTLDEVEAKGHMIRKSICFSRDVDLFLCCFFRHNDVTVYMLPAFFVKQLAQVAHGR